MRQLLVFLLAVSIVGSHPAMSDAFAADEEKPADDATAQPAQPANDAETADIVEPKHPFPRHVKSPSLDGGTEWFNTAGPLDVKDLRGKFVVLDFWTYCCINCIHILPELKKLEHAYPNELVVIGVHSAKFETEKNAENIREAILRYEIEHPVVNDAEHKIWNKFGVSSWPSLIVIDPEGNIVAINRGEITFEALDAFFKRALPYYKARKLLDTKPLKFNLEAARARAATPLRFPGKILADESGGRLFISDSNHNRIVVTDLQGKLQATIGSGAIGRADGDFASAEFDHPQGMALRGDTLYVADTENHLLRKVDLAKQRVTTIAGTGEQARRGWPGMERLAGGNPTGGLPDRWVGPPKTTALNSPWALLIHEQDLYIAMAGPHQIWKMPLDESEIGIYAGSGREDIVDGPVLPRQPYGESYAAFAQPSGLASDGTWLYVADSEGSSIRAVPFDSKKEVRTIIGTPRLPFARLFLFGDRDGKGLVAPNAPEGSFRGQAEQTTGPLLQHCLGVAYDAGKLYLADTYNNKIKVVDVAEKSCHTLAGTGEPGVADEPAQFDEPAGIALAGKKLYVADTNNHAIRVIDLANGNKVSTLAIAGLTPPRPPKAKSQPLALPGAVEQELPPQNISVGDAKTLKFQLAIELPNGWKINPIAPQRYFVQIEGESPLFGDSARLGEFISPEKPTRELTIELPVTAVTGKVNLRVGLAYYYCQEGAEGLCRAGSAIWTVPVHLDSKAKAKIVKLKAKAK